MKRLSAALLALVLSLILAPAAFADTINFAIAGTGNGTGTVTLNFTVDGYLVTSGADKGDFVITGLRPLSQETATFSLPDKGATKITSLYTTGYLNNSSAGLSGTADSIGYGGTTGGAGDYDDLVYKNIDGLKWGLDKYGLAFTLNNGDDLQVFFASYKGSLDVVIVDTDSNGTADTYKASTSNFTFTTFAPEPSTLTLFGTGLLGLAGLIRRKYAQSL